MITRYRAWRKLRKIGGSLVVVLPSSFTRNAGMKVGDEVVVDVVGPVAIVGSVASLSRLDPAKYTRWMSDEFLESKKTK